MSFFRNPSQKECSFSLFSCYWKENPQSAEGIMSGNAHELTINYSDQQSSLSQFNSRLSCQYQKLPHYNKSQKQCEKTAASTAKHFFSKFGESQNQLTRQKIRKQSQSSISLKKQQLNKKSLKNQTKVRRNSSSLNDIICQLNQEVDSKQFIHKHRMPEKNSLYTIKQNIPCRKQMGVQYQPEIGTPLFANSVEEVQSPLFRASESYHPIANINRQIVPLNRLSFKKKSWEDSQKNNYNPIIQENYSKRSKMDELSTRHYSNIGVIDSGSKFGGATSMVMKNSPLTSKQQSSSRVLKNLTEISKNVWSFSDAPPSEKQSLVMSLAQSSCKDSEYSQGAKFYRTIKRLTTKQI